MGTLSTEDFNFRLNMDLVERQYQEALREKSVSSAEYQKALKMFQKGTSCLESRDYSMAHESFTQALKVILGKGVTDLEAACLFFLSLLLISCGKEKGALQGFNIVFTNTEDSLLKLSILNRLSIYYLSNDNLQKVHECTELSLALIDQLEETKFIKYYKAASNYNKSEAYVRNSECSSALPYIRAATEQFSEIDLKLESAKCSSLMGTIYTITKRYEDALNHLNYAIQAYKKHEDNDEMVTILRNMGLCHLGLGEKEKGLSKLKGALTFAQKIGNTKNLNLLIAEIASHEANLYE